MDVGFGEGERSAYANRSLRSVASASAGIGWARVFWFGVFDGITGVALIGF